MDALKNAIEDAGGVVKFAALLGCGQSVVSNWLMRGQVPADRCIAIETATGGAVTRYDLRPDVFGAAPEDRAA